MYSKVYKKCVCNFGGTCTKHHVETLIRHPLNVKFFPQLVLH